MKEGDKMKACSLLEGMIFGMIIVFGVILMMPRKYFNKVKRLRRKTSRSMGSINSVIDDVM